MRYLRVDEVVDSVSITHSFEQDEVYFLNTSDIFNGSIISPRRMKIGDLKGQAKKTIMNNDILFSEIRPQNKRYAFVKIENPVEYVVSTKLMVLRNKNSDVLQKYFYYFITSDSVLEYLQKRAESRICSFPQITFSLFSGMEFPVPDIKTQLKIVSKLDAISNKIELNNRLNNALEEYCHLLFHKWFVNFDYPDSYGISPSEGKYIKTMPLGWVEDTFGKVSKLNMGISPTGDTYNNEKNGIPLLNGAGDFDNGIIRPTKFTTKPQKECFKGDLIFCIRGTIGYVTLSDGHYAIGRGVASIKPTKEIHKYLVYLKLKQSIETIAKQASGSIIKGLTKDDIDGIAIIVPDDITCERFNKLIQPITDKIASNIKENSLLAEARDLLVKKLFK